MRDIPKSSWPRLSPVLDELLDLDPPARQQRLAALRAEDAGLADDLEALLDRDASPAGQAFLDAPALPTLTAAVLMAGQNVGAYTLEREIGHGGMGSVWLARRTDGRFEGQVAIKFLSAGLLGHGDAGRFAREGQILGRLAHPHIARLIDAGVAPEGRQPYLVLEYIDGLPIDAFCEQQQLDVAGRVRLFLAVLGAVAHAHNRLILHRDLKPSNILVNAAGEVKLLDFGIAKLLGDASQPTGATELTQRAGNAYTPQYASPEQVQGGDVTTATDVYALGVLLYMLLGGPHPTAQVSASSLERLRAVVEAEPRRLSDAVPRRQARELRGDLDTIVARTLKKAPAERYANAAALAEDLRRWLDHEPIAARPDSAAYLLGKFVRRHRLGVAAGGLIVLALGTGVGVALWEARETERQRAQAEGLIEFMLGDLRKRLEPVGRLDVMDAVGAKALTYYAGQSTGRQDPDALGRRARAMHLMGEIAEKRGKLDEADQMFREAAAGTAELLARSPGDGQRVFDHSQSVYWVGFVAWRRGQAQEAQQQFRRYLELAEQLPRLAPERQEWLAERGHAGVNLGMLQLESGQVPAALRSFTAARAVWQDLVPQDPGLHLELANTLGWIANAEEDRGDYAASLAAEQAKLQALAQQPDALQNRDVQLQQAHGQHQIGRLQLLLGQPRDASASARRAVSQFEAVAATDKSNLNWLTQLCTARLGLAEMLDPVGDQAELSPLLALLEADIARLRSTSQLAIPLALQGRLGLLQGPPAAQAEALRRFLAEAQALGAGGTKFNAEQQRIVAKAQLRLGDLSPEPAAARRAWQAARDGLGQPASLPAQTLLAQAQLRLGAIEEARTLADKVEASAFRHPDYADLRRRLKLHSEGLQ